MYVWAHTYRMSSWLIHRLDFTVGDWRTFGSILWLVGVTGHCFKKYFDCQWMGMRKMSELPRNGYQDKHLVHIVSNHQLKGKKKKLPNRRQNHCWKKSKKQKKTFFWKVNIKCNFEEKQRKEQNRQREVDTLFW